MFTLLASDQKQYGPATVEQVREWVTLGRADQTTLARPDANAAWKPLAAFPEFANLFTAPEPPPIINPPRVASQEILPKRKFSLLLGPRGAITRERALVCAATNLAVPGFGSLFGRRVIGYAQLALYSVAFGLSLIGGGATMKWYAANSDKLQEMSDSPDLYFQQLWIHFRWPVLGIFLFLIAIAWAWLTSRSLMAEARRNSQTNRIFVPPKI